MKVKASRIKKRVTWAKGHSSDSNPVTRKHRDVARAQLRIYGKGLLPVDHDGGQALKSNPLSFVDHQAVGATDKSTDVKEDDAFSLNSLDSILSDFTSCTNVTFSKLHHNWDMGSAMHKDILAVLASVTEVIRCENGTETELEYFAALVSALSSPLADESSLLAATLYLLSLVIRRIPQNVLRNKFKDISTVLFPIFTSCVDSDSGGMKTSVVRYAMTCTTSLLLAQGVGVWSDPSPQRAMQTILNLCITEKPKLRKVAQKSVATILYSGSASTLIDSENEGLKVDYKHPASNLISGFCGRVLREGLNGMSEEGASPSNPTLSTLHVLNLLSAILPSLSANNVRSLVEAMLRLLMLDKPLVRFGVLQALDSMLSRRPPPEVVSMETCGSMIAALYDCRPSLADNQLIVPWCGVMRAGHIVMSDRDTLMAVKCLPRLFEEYLALLRGCSDACLPSIVDNFAICIDKCIGATLASDGGCTMQYYGNGSAVNWDQDILSAVNQTLVSMDELLSYQFVGFWPLALRLFAVFFSTVGRLCSSLPQFSATLKSIAELRESDSIADKRQLDIIIGAGIKCIGPDVILEAIPLKLPRDPAGGVGEFERSWLLPILGQNVGPGARLNYYINKIMPIAIDYYDRMVKFKENEGSLAQVKLLDIVQGQLWAILPGFCKCPADFVDAFPKIAPVLGSLLVERPTLRLTILNSLRTAISSLDPTENGDSLKVMSQFAKNYMPILISLYVNDIVAKENCTPGYDALGVHLAVFETMKLMVRIAPIENLKNYLDVAIQKINTSEPLSKNKKEADKMTTSVMDVLVALAGRLDPDQLQSAFSALKPFFGDQSSCDGSLLKKSYRFLSEVLQLSVDSGGEGDDADSVVANNFTVFVERNIADLTVILSNISSKASPATKACRFVCIGCLASFIGHQPVVVEENSQFLRSTLQDVVLGLVEQSSRAKKCAAKAVVQIFEAIRRILSEDGDVSVGLKGFSDWLADSLSHSDVRVRTACLIALRLLIYEYRSDVSSSAASEYLSKVIAVLDNSSSDRPVVEAALSFVKTFVVSFPMVTVGQFLEIFLPQIFRLSEDCQHHFRFLVRKVLIKVVKKFSYEQVRNLVPEHHQKLLSNVRRIVARRQRRLESERAGTKTRSQNDEDQGSTFDVASLTTAMSGVTTRVESIADLLEDSDSDPEGDELDGKTSVSSRKTSKSLGSKSKKGSVVSRRSSVKVPVWMEEGTADDVVDLMDSRAAQRVTTVNPGAIRQRQVTLMSADRLKGFKTASDGRIIIANDGDGDDANNSDGNSSDDDDKGDVKSIAAGSKRKRALNTAQSENGKRAKLERVSDEVADGNVGYRPGGQGIHRSFKVGKSKSGSGHVKDKSAFYRSGKGAGDVKRKGAPDPYAYLPLDMGALNRRKKAKYHGQYKHIVQGAKKGATKGSKHRGKRD